MATKKFKLGNVPMPPSGGNAPPDATSTPQPSSPPYKAGAFHNRGNNISIPSFPSTSKKTTFSLPQTGVMVPQVDPLKENVGNFTPPASPQPSVPPPLPNNPTLSEGGKHESMQNKLDYKVLQKVSALESKIGMFEKELDYNGANINKIWETFQLHNHQIELLNARCMGLGWKTRLMELDYAQLTGLKVQEDYMKQARIEIDRWEQQVQLLTQQIQILKSRLNPTPQQNNQMGANSFMGLLGNQ